MNSLDDIVWKIGETQAQIRRIDELARRQGASPSLVASRESLQRREELLEKSYLDLSDIAGLDVCSYRIFTEGEGGFPVSALGRSLSYFQTWFSVTFDALKRGPKSTAHLSAEVVAQSSMNFAFSFTGSVGVVLAVPSERLLFENELQLTMEKTRDLMNVQSADELQEFSRLLGVAPIKALYNWVDTHVRSGAGVQINWHRGEEPLYEVFVSPRRMEEIRQIMNLPGETYEEVFVAEGLLVGADTENHLFHLLVPDADPIQGKMNEVIGQGEEIRLPRHCRATIRKTSVVDYTLDEARTTYFLEILHQ